MTREGMTREEAKELLLHILMTYEPKDQYGDYDDPEPYEQALTMAIEALTEPIGDQISRSRLFNKLATVQAPPEANEYKAEVYKIIQSMGTEEDDDK